MCDELLSLRNVSKSYGGHAALRGLSLAIAPGEIVGLIGPSGSGKTTLARCAAGFENPDSGEVVRNCDPIRIQLIVQQPAASLNPRFTARQILEEPLVIQKRNRTGAAERAMELVGLPAIALEKRALEFSGGERQRLALARALVLDPKLLILDESFAGLDWRMQEQMIALLENLHQTLQLAALLISHDLQIVAEIAQKIAVMQNGEIVEQGPAHDLMAAPTHHLTRELIAAAKALSLPRGVT